MIAIHRTDTNPRNTFFFINIHFAAFLDSPDVRHGYEIGIKRDVGICTSAHPTRWLSHCLSPGQATQLAHASVEYMHHHATNRGDVWAKYSPNVDAYLVAVSSGVNKFARFAR